LKICEKVSIHRTLQRVITKREQYKSLFMNNRALRRYFPNIVYLDESSFNKSIVNRKHGRAPIGQKAINNKIITPGSAFRCTLQAAINGDHVIHSKIVETPGYGANSNDFATFLEELLEIMPINGILVLDNAVIHRTSTITSMLTNAKTSKNIRTIFTAPYSPEWSPSELIVHLLKQKLKDATINIDNPRIFFDDVLRTMAEIPSTAFMGFYVHTFKRIIQDRA
jgi:transposase